VLNENGINIFFMQTPIQFLNILLKPEQQTTTITRFFPKKKVLAHGERASFFENVSMSGI